MQVYTPEHDMPLPVMAFLSKMVADCSPGSACSLAAEALVQQGTARRATIMIAVYSWGCRQGYTYADGLLQNCPGVFKGLPVRHTRISFVCRLLHCT